LACRWLHCAPLDGLKMCALLVDITGELLAAQLGCATKLRPQGSHEGRSTTQVVEACRGIARGTSSNFTQDLALGGTGPDDLAMLLECWHKLAFISYGNSMTSKRVPPITAHRAAMGWSIAE
jgi:hypothetical protein